MFFIQPTAEQLHRALESWQWLPIENKTPFAVTALGDVFLEADDGIWFLDRIEGALTFAAQDHQSLQDTLDAESGQDHYLWYDLLESARESGLQLKPNECFDFIDAPVLGGQAEVGNLKARDFELVLRIAGQVHEQIRDLPVGTELDQLRIA